MERVLNTYKTDGVIFEDDNKLTRKYYNEYIKQTDYWKKTKLLRIILLMFSFGPVIFAMSELRHTSQFFLIFISIILFFEIGYLVIYFLPIHYIKKRCAYDIHEDKSPNICITNSYLSFLYTIGSVVSTEITYIEGDLAIEERIDFDKIDYIVYNTKDKTLEVKGDYHKITHQKNYNNPGSLEVIRDEDTVRKIFLSHNNKDIILNTLLEKLGNRMKFI